MPKNSWKWVNFLVSRALVNMSAMLSWVLIYDSVISCDWMHSRSKWCLISMCFMWSWRRGSSDRLMAALLSQSKLVGFCGWWLITLKSVQSHIASLQASNAATYSASQEEAATVFCLWACQEIMPDLVCRHVLQCFVSNLGSLPNLNQ